MSHKAKIEVSGPYGMARGRKIPDAWFYREYTTRGLDTGEVEIHADIDIDGEMYHVILKSAKRTKRETHFLRAALTGSDT